MEHRLCYPYIHWILQFQVPQPLVITETPHTSLIQVEITSTASRNLKLNCSLVRGGLYRTSIALLKAKTAILIDNGWSTNCLCACLWLQVGYLSTKGFYILVDSKHCSANWLSSWGRLQYASSSGCPSLIFAASVSLVAFLLLLTSRQGWMAFVLVLVVVVLLVVPLQ